jgi:thioredoxin-related protein
MNENLEVLIFTQRNCPPCAALKPVILKLQDLHKFRVRIVEASAETRDLFMKFNVRSAPTVVCVDQNDKEVGRFNNVGPALVVEQYLKNWGVIEK